MFTDSVYVRLKTAHFIIAIFLVLACAQNVWAEAPESGDIPDQTVSQGQTFDDIRLNDYVDDDDDDDRDITWTYTGNTELSVSIVRRNEAEISIPDSSWSGSETITFTATDSDGESSSDTATFTVIAVNSAPSVGNIIGQTIVEGAVFTSIDLNSYVVDAEDNDSAIRWTYSGNRDLRVSLNESTHVATISAPDADWNGSESITFTATDTGGLSDSDAATFTVTSVNDAPVVGNIPSQTIDEGGTFADIKLDSFVSDIDDPDNQIAWTFSGNTRLSVEIKKRVATVTVPNNNWSGSETITFTATDPGGLSSSDTATFTVIAVNSAPSVGNIMDQTVAEGGAFASIDLDNFVADAEDNDSAIEWTYSCNRDVRGSVNGTTHVATISAPNADWSGS